MKWSRLIFWCLVCVAFSSTQAAEPQKWALLVGINKYRNLPDLAGAVNDVADMKDLLVKKLGFPESHIFTLLDGQATRAAILARFESELIARVAENDTAVFHFSGHGSQMADVSGDEPDGKDESLVPHNSREAGVYDISDDEIHALLTRLTQRCRNATFIFDSCHSGSGQRAGSWRMVPPDPRQPPGIRSGGAPSDEGAHGLGRVEAENYVMISACRSTQVAGEIDVNKRKQGALTHHLVKVLRRAEANTTWNDVMDEVTRGVCGRFRGQTPELHGVRDRVVFGVRELPDEPHILVSPAGEGQLKLEAGLVHGLTVGSVFDIYASGKKRRENRHPIGRARVTEVGHFTARAELLDGGPVAEGAWAVEREHNYPGKRLFVYYKGRATEALQTELADIKMIQTVDEPSEAHLIIEHHTAGKRFLLSDRDGTIMGAPLSDADPKAVCRVILRWARWFNVLSIESSGPTTPNVAFTISHATGSMRSGFAHIGEGEAVFREGDDLVFKVTNQSRRNVYITILGLSTSGEIGPIHPEPGEVQQPIPPGKSWSVEITVELAAGISSEKTILKLFATLKPIDLRFLYQPGARSAGGMHPLEVLPAPGARGANLRPARWTALQKVTVIKKKGAD